MFRMVETNHETRSNFSLKFINYFIIFSFFHLLSLNYFTVKWHDKNPKKYNIRTFAKLVYAGKKIRPRIFWIDYNIRIGTVITFGWLIVFLVQCYTNNRIRPLDSLHWYLVKQASASSFETNPTSNQEDLETVVQLRHSSVSRGFQNGEIPSQCLDEA